MILRQLFDKNSSTYTYLVADPTTQKACLIDPVRENIKQYLQLLSELNVQLAFAVDTHVHADHVTALGDLRELTQCITMVGSQGDVDCTTEALFDGKALSIGNIHLTAMYTPGHTADSYSFYVEDKGRHYVFTGDTLLIRGTGRTDFQNGDPSQLYDSLHKKLLSLPVETVVLPGHDYRGWTRSTIAEEKQHNLRLQFTSRDAFIEHMNNLNLPDPKLMDIAIPANMACGKGALQHG